MLNGDTDEIWCAGARLTRLGTCVQLHRRPDACVVPGFLSSSSMLSTCPMLAWCAAKRFWPRRSTVTRSRIIGPKLISG